MSEISTLNGEVITNGDIRGQYCIIDDVMDFLRDHGLNCKITEEAVNGFAKFAKIYIDNETQRDFSYHQGAIEFHHGNGKNEIQSYFFPIRKITHVILYNQTLQAMRTFLDQELIVNPDRGQIALPPIYPVYITDTPYEALFGNVFIPGIYNIELEYDYGYDKPPQDITMCACIYVAKKILTAHWTTLSGGLTGASVPGYNESYGGMPYGNLFDEWNKEFDRLLSKRKRIYARSI